MKLKLKAGFTLIELLVVIAIIGILAALVLVSLGNARQKAQDAKVKSNIAQIRTLAEIYYDSTNATYTAFGSGCWATPSAALCHGGIYSSIDALKLDNPTTAIVTSTATNYCISAPLISEPLDSFCVDSTGSTGNVACSGGVCPP